MSESDKENKERLEANALKVQGYVDKAKSVLMYRLDNTTTLEMYKSMASGIEDIIREQGRDND